MSKHTPGLWEVLSYSNHDLQTDFAMVKIGKSAHMIGHTEQDIANARLIAASPELLEALENLLAVMNGEGGTRANAQEIARQAIAKATGEQQ